MSRMRDAYDALQRAHDDPSVRQTPAALLALLQEFERDIREQYTARLDELGQALQEDRGWQSERETT